MTEKNSVLQSGKPGSLVNYYYRQFEILADISKWNNMEMEFISISCQILCERNYNQEIPVESPSQLLNIHSH